MNKSAFLICLTGLIAMLHDGRFAPEQTQELTERVDKVPSEVRGEFYEGRVSLPEDCERAMREARALPALAGSLWDRVRDRATEVMSDMHRFVQHVSTSVSNQPADKT